jgi:peptidoglycan hydrolase-like protein with peptidoglycan-binding domain
LVPEVQSNNKSLSSIIDLFIALGIISSEKALMARSFSANDVIVATTPTKSVSSSSTRSFSVGAKGEDVRFLQKALNTKSFFVAQKGDGSLGNETTYFGISTERALKLFQCKTFAICSGTPATTGYGLVGPKTSTALGI